VTIYLVREEAVVASGEYHFRKKQTDTGQDDEELMASLGLVEGGSRAGQGSIETSHYAGSGDKPNRD
jgi:hypothetical protein